MFAAGGYGTLLKLDGIDVVWDSEHKTLNGISLQLRGLSMMH